MTSRGHISSLIEPCYFIADGVFATNSGEVGIVIQFTGPDPECMEDVDKEAVTHRWRKAIGSLNDVVVYQYLLKRKDNGLFTMRSYIVLMSKLSMERSQMESRITAATSAAAAGIQDKAASFVSQADFINATVLGSEDVWLFLRELTNYNPAAAKDVAFSESVRIDQRLMADSEIGVWPDRIRVGSHYVSILTLKEPPSTTSPDFVRAIREMEAECNIVTEWRPMDVHETRKLILSKTTHFHNKRYAVSIPKAVIGSLISAFKGAGAEERPEHMQQDKSAVSQEDELGNLATEIETAGARLGQFAMTIVMPSVDGTQNTYEALRSLGATDAILYQEKLNTCSQWVSSLPGGRKHQFRYMYLTDANHADMSMLFSVATGSQVNEHLNAECLAVLDTRQRTPYYLNLHTQDVGHAAVIGQTGSGKSFTCAYLMERVQQYSPRTVIFDIGGGYRKLCERVGGSYIEIGLENRFSMNPLALPRTPENIQFICSFARVLVESGDHRMTDIEKEAVYASVSEKNPGRLSELRLPFSLVPHMRRWLQGGQYGSLFDNEIDTMTTTDFQVVDFEQLEQYPEIIEPVLFFILHRMSNAVNDDPGRLKVFLVDEAWKFFLNQTVKDYITRALKTWRKRNGMMILATQSSGDMEKSGMLQVVVENAGTLLMLSNPRMDADHYQRIFHLNNVETKAVLTMRPKCEILVKKPTESKIVQLNIKKEPVCIQSSSQGLFSVASVAARVF